MVLAPINTDAPIYHWPRATVGLIAANVLVFLVTASGVAGSFDQIVQQFGLVHGSGLQPWQWITSNFLHQNLLHLAGNMVFLWGLGLVVEGKIGWKKFLLLYFGIGIIECALEQVLLGFVTFVSFGSSAIVFALLAVAMVWAPRNELMIGFWLPVFGVSSFDISISTFTLIVLAAQGLLAWWIGPAVLLHLIGALIGFAAATFMLKKGYVDCEGWDLYSVLSGRRPVPVASDAYVPILERPPEQRPNIESSRPARPSDPDRNVVLRKAKIIKRVRALLERGRPVDAYKSWRKNQHLLGDWQLPAADYLRLADALHDAQQWSEAVALWDEYIAAHPQSADPIRLIAAEVVLNRLNRPHAAFKLIEPLENVRLHPRQEAVRQSIIRESRKLIDSGVIEFDHAPWK